MKGRAQKRNSRSKRGKFRYRTHIVVKIYVVGSRETTQGKGSNN